MGIVRLDNDPVLKAAHEITVSRGMKTWLVGGVIRNILLGSPVQRDYDFIVSGDVESFSTGLAGRLGGAAFLLDSETSTWRIAVNGTEPLTVDVSILKGDIVRDLGLRDFTVNAIAADLDGIFAGRPALIDPCHGEADCGKRVLRAVSKTVFDDDPLRALRGIRIAAQYCLGLDGKTEHLLRSKSGLLAGVSEERIREELISIFSIPSSSAPVRQIYSMGIADAVLPEISRWEDVEGYGLLAHSIKALEEAERILGGLEGFPYHERLEAHFASTECVPGNRVLFKLCAFLHDIGKPVTLKREGGRLRFIGHDVEGSRIAREMLLRLKFSKRASAWVANIVKNHHRTFMLALLKERTFRAKGHFFRASGGVAGVDLLLLALADARATRGGEDEELRSIVEEMLSFYYDAYVKEKPRPLMDGTDIMKVFGVPQGKTVGKIMRMIDEGVESGTIKNMAGAVEYVRGRLSGKQDPAG